MTNKEFSIYIHIPFCISKCAYCAFYSEKRDENLESRYIDALIKTISYFSKNYIDASMTVKTVYFGGGTPTVIDSELLCEVLAHIKNNLKLSADCEITIEANPKTVSFEDALLLKQAGFNRVSLGAQTTDNNRLKTLGRIHTWEECREAYELLKRAGFSNISVDLMYALPDTELNDVFDDIKNITSLNPSHISTYALSLEEGTPLFNRQENYIFPDDEKQLEMYLTICEKLSELGYCHYEISNFCKSGMESRHNSGYWTRRDYIGFGSGAHSLWNDERFYLPSNRLDFIKNVEDSNFESALGIDSKEKLSKEDVAEEEIMLSLRTNKGINLPSLSSKLERFVKDGFATYQDGIFSLTDKGYFVSNTIIYNVCKELLYASE